MRSIFNDKSLLYGGNYRPYRRSGRSFWTSFINDLTKDNFYFSSSKTKLRKVMSGRDLETLEKIKKNFGLMHSNIVLELHPLSSHNVPPDPIALNFKTVSLKYAFLITNYDNCQYVSCAPQKYMRSKLLYMAMVLSRISGNSIKYSSFHYFLKCGKLCGGMLRKIDFPHSSLDLTSKSCLLIEKKINTRLYPIAAEIFPDDNDKDLFFDTFADITKENALYLFFKYGLQVSGEARGQSYPYVHLNSLNQASLHTFSHISYHVESISALYLRCKFGCGITLPNALIRDLLVAQFYIKYNPLKNYVERVVEYVRKEFSIILDPAKWKGDPLDIIYRVVDHSGANDGGSLDFLKISKDLFYGVQQGLETSIVVTTLDLLKNCSFRKNTPTWDFYSLFYRYYTVSRGLQRDSDYDPPERLAFPYIILETELEATVTVNPYRMFYFSLIEDREKFVSDWWNLSFRVQLGVHLAPEYFITHLTSFVEHFKVRNAGSSKFFFNSAQLFYYLGCVPRYHIFIKKFMAKYKYRSYSCEVAYLLHTFYSDLRGPSTPTSNLIYEAFSFWRRDFSFIHRGVPTFLDDAYLSLDLSPPRAIGPYLTISAADPDFLFDFMLITANYDSRDWTSTDWAVDRLLTLGGYDWALVKLRLFVSFFIKFPGCDDEARQVLNHFILLDFASGTEEEKMLLVLSWVIHTYVYASREVDRLARTTMELCMTSLGIVTEEQVESLLIAVGRESLASL